MMMLSIEEMNWESNNKNKYIKMSENFMISKLLQELISLRIFYYSYFTINVVNKFRYIQVSIYKFAKNQKNIIITLI